MSSNTNTFIYETFLVGIDRSLARPIVWYFFNFWYFFPDYCKTYEVHYFGSDAVDCFCIRSVVWRKCPVYSSLIGYVSWGSQSLKTMQPTDESISIAEPLQWISRAVFQRWRCFWSSNKSIIFHKHDELLCYTENAPIIQLFKVKWCHWNVCVATVECAVPCSLWLTLSKVL